MVPLRADSKTPDADDEKRIALVTERWAMQDQAYTTIERTIEEHVRFLAGRQWDVWSDVVQGFVDPTRYMNPEELRWRQRPVMDYLGYWYMVTLSKVTENEPIVGFLPANGDEHSARLAEVMDPIFKTLREETEMGNRRIHAAAWVLAAGEAYYVSRPDYKTGETRPRVGPAVIPYGEEEDAQEVVIEDAPYDEDGNPLVAVLPDENTGELSYEVTGDPYLDRKGCLRVDVASPLEIRSQWGSHIPWNEKLWIAHRWFLSPEEVEETYGVKVEANVSPISNDVAPGTLERMLFGAGYFGASRGDRAAQSTEADGKLVQEFVQGFTMWEKPTPSFPDGRLLVVAGDKVLFDGPRPFQTECAGPIRRIQFMPLPGRPIGTSPLEKMVPLQKRYNRVEAQIAEHTNLSTNPIFLYHTDAGLADEEMEARPGLKIPHSAPAGIRPAEWLSPPALGIDVWKHKQDVRDHLFTIGSITGNDSSMPGSDSSGELVSQLRFNADRPLSPMTRSMEQAEAGVAEDWLAILPTIWDDETVIFYSGEDNVVRTATVLPELWDGTVKARPVMESAAPESREKRFERVLALYQMGAFGNLQDPTQAQQATNRLLTLSRYPELNRAARPGGVHRVMAEHNLGKLLRGIPADTIPVLPVYDLVVHLAVMEEFMASPDFLRSEYQEAVATYWQTLKTAQMVQMQQMMLEQGAVNMTAQATGAIPAGAPPSESGHNEDSTNVGRDSGGN
jgi:hypothetical protein